MGMANSLWTGANGLYTYQSAINALSDNVANINSVGYKKLDTTFNDLLYSTSCAPPPPPTAITALPISMPWAMA